MNTERRSAITMGETTNEAIEMGPGIRSAERREGGERPAHPLGRFSWPRQRQGRSPSLSFAMAEKCRAV
jgi:hypothetical protein